MKLRVIQFPLQVNYANAFLAFDQNSRDAFLVDCGAFEDQIADYIASENLNVKALLLTHSHYDHVDGVQDFKKQFPVPVYASTNSYDQKVSEGDSIPFADTAIHVLATPGHTSDGVSYLVDKAVFVGDAIFAGAVGGTSSRKHFEEEAEHVSRKVFTLPDETVIYPGHGAASLVAVERLFNPFFL